jgi:hypothetical protein
MPFASHHILQVMKLIRIECSRSAEAIVSSNFSTKVPSSHVSNKETHKNKIKCQCTQRTFTFIRNEILRKITENCADGSFN